MAKSEWRMANGEWRLVVVELAVDFGDEEGDDFIQQFDAVLVNFDP